MAKPLFIEGLEKVFLLLLHMCTILYVPYCYASIDY